jgi:formylglycine-generating enzyme required for sulfatase activity
MVWIPAGTFEMGSNDGDSDEKPVHAVTLDGFWIGKYEVTQRQYEAMMGNNPSHFKGPDRPVEQVSWNDAMEFCRKLSQATGKTYTLPTEAQWEYACRAGSKSNWDEENRLGDYAWYERNSGNKTHDVGGKSPNQWGLYDMHGNVWEWCADWFEGIYYASSPPRNPTGPASGKYRVFRGGGWCGTAYNCRSASRLSGSLLDVPDAWFVSVGVRLLRTQE